MAEIKYIGELPRLNYDNKIQQGDIVYCQSTTRKSGSFWAVYGHDCGLVTLDGGSTAYIREKDVYLGETYSYWTIVKRIPCSNAKITIEEK